MSRTRYTNAAIIAALHENHGLVSLAARNLGCDRGTIYKRAKKHPTVQQAIDDARDLMTDEAESALYKAIKRGEAWAVCFYLKTQGKARGYVERQEVTGADGGPAAFTFTLAVGDRDGRDPASEGR